MPLEAQKVAAEGSAWTLHCPGHFTNGKEPPYPLYRRQGGLRASLDRC